MAVLRAFIAIDLPTPLRDKLEQASSALRSNFDGLPLRWVPAENVHLTLKFLGDVSESNLDMIAEILDTLGRQQNRFEISVGGLGVFPNARRPRVFWVGVEAPEDLTNLHHRIESESARLGYALEERHFEPHLTLGRVSRNASPKEIQRISKLYEKENLGFLGVAAVEKVHIYRSDLQTGGAKYTRLFSAPLIESAGNS